MGVVETGLRHHPAVFGGTRAFSKLLSVLIQLIFSLNTVVGKTLKYTDGFTHAHSYRSLYIYAYKAQAFSIMYRTLEECYKQY